MYKLNRFGNAVTDTITGECLAVDSEKYKTWLAQGNVPDPADPPTPTEQRAAIQNQIDSLEKEQLLPRVTREGLLLTMETFAAMQGVTPAQLYIDNIAYKKVKDFDTQITLLRAQL